MREDNHDFRKSGSEIFGPKVLAAAIGLNSQAKLVFRRTRLSGVFNRAEAANWPRSIR
jgi:hypothetical protein